VERETRLELATPTLAETSGVRAERDPRTVDVCPGDGAMESVKLYTPEAESPLVVAVVHLAGRGKTPDRSARPPMPSFP
jgi:hypothetical protein